MNPEKIQRSPLARGKKELLAHVQGKSLTRSKAMLAKCYDCMGGYFDGKVDCKIHDCPLYPWMPFRNKGVETSPESIP